MHCGVELAGALPVVQRGNAVHTEAIHDLRSGIAQGDLLGREADVHQSGWAGEEVGSHSSLSVRRSTLPEGVRGTASTRTT